MNFSIQSRHLMLMALVCLISVTIQTKQQSHPAAAVAVDSSLDQVDSSNENVAINDANRKILIKYLQKAFSEMNDQAESDYNEEEAYGQRVARSDSSKSNDRLKEFFIKRAMKNVALGFGKKWTASQKKRSEKNVNCLHNQYFNSQHFLKLKLNILKINIVSLF